MGRREGDASFHTFEEYFFARSVRLTRVAWMLTIGLIAVLPARTAELIFASCPTLPRFPGGLRHAISLLATVALAYAGTTRVEGMWWAVLTSFLVYTGLVIWAAATRRVWMTSAVIIGGAALMIITSPILATQLELAATT